MFAAIAPPPLKKWSRRRFLGVVPAAALAGCAQPRFFSPSLQPAGKPLVLAPVAVSTDRIIRRVVGLRPYRPSGFVIRSEPLGDKVLVHHYGHGGSGVTLSWGTAALAIKQPYPNVLNYAVLGCGAVGLATARLLQERGARVTIYAKQLPPETTSNVAGARWWPSGLYDEDRLTPAFQKQLIEASHYAYLRFQSMIGERYGVRWLRSYLLSNTPFAEYAPHDSRVLLADLQPEARDLSPREHPFEMPYVRQWDSMMIEPSRYLSAILRDFLSAGGKLVITEFNSVQEVARLEERVIFNCTGLGAGALFSDPELIPVKGQLTVLLPQPEVTYNVSFESRYMFPRQDGILLGGTTVRGDWSLMPDLAEEERILADHRAVFEKMRG